MNILEEAVLKDEDIVGVQQISGYDPLRNVCRVRVYYRAGFTVEDEATLELMESLRPELRREPDFAPNLDANQ